MRKFLRVVCCEKGLENDDKYISRENTRGLVAYAELISRLIAYSTLTQVVSHKSHRLLLEQ